MAYNGDKSWDQLVEDIEPKAATLLKAIREGQAAYDEWQSFRNSRTNADIATALSRTESEVADMDAAFSAFDSISRYLDNNTPPVGINHGFAVRVFS